MQPIRHENIAEVVRPPRVRRFAHEYPFPLHSIDQSPDAEQLAAAARVVGTQLIEVRAALAARFRSVRSRKVWNFLRVFDGFVPHSILIRGTSRWVVMKLETRLQEPTENDNSIMIPCECTNLKNDSVEGFGFSRIPYLLEFLNHFAGLSLDVIDSGVGVPPPDRLWTAGSSDLGGLQQWEGSLATYFPGNGDILLANRHGAAGRWEHETAPPVGDPGPPMIDLSDIVPGWSDAIDPDIEAVDDLECGIIEAVDREIRDRFTRVHGYRYQTFVRTIASVSDDRASG